MTKIERRVLPLVAVANKPVLSILVALMLMLFVVGCGSSGNDIVFDDPGHVTPTIEHRITVVFDEPQNQEFLPIANSLEQSGFYQRLADNFSEVFVLPKDVTLRFTELNTVNAFWNSDSNEIRIAYELISAYSELFEFDPLDPDAVTSEYIDASLYSVLHELGHCFVTLFDLPITGREEDAVDEFATLILAEIKDQNSFNALVSGMKQFYSDAGESGSVIDESAFADEHSLDKQRFYATLFLAYGSNPSAYQSFISEGILTEEKASQAPEEYKAKVRTWERLLAPFER